MKYWVFNGNDVVGPFALQEIAARADFSANTLICAEDASEDAAGWQMASFFDVFRFNPSNGQLEVVLLPDGSALRANPAAPQAEVLPQQVNKARQQASKAAAQAAAQAAAILPDALKPGAGPAKAPAPEMLAQENPSWVPPAQVAHPTTEKPLPVAKPAQAPLPSTPKQAPKPADKPTEKPLPSVVKQPAPKPQPVPVAKEKVHTQPPTPVALARENVDLVLPKQPVTEKPAPAPEKKPDAAPSQVQKPAPAPQPAPVGEEPKPQPAPEPKEKPQTVSPEKSAPEVHKVPEENKKPSGPALAAPETEILSTCTLPIVNEVLTQSDLPRLPEEGFQPVALPAEPEFDFKEFLAGDVPAQEPPLPLAPPQAQVIEDDPVDEGGVPAETKLVTITDLQYAAVLEKPTGQFVDQSDDALEPEERVIGNVHQAPQRPQEEAIQEIEQKFTPRSRQQENARLEKELLEQPTRRSAHVVLWILLLLVLGGAGWMAWPKYIKPKLPMLEKLIQQYTQPAVQPQPVEPQPVEPQSAAPKVSAAPSVTPPKPVTAEEKALAAVQNYQLPNGKGTIASYFDRVYQDRISQGYTAHWSVEPLHKSTYIVKYRLTKTRTEPVVYVFQADAVRGQLTGALNNIALDLVGRI